MRPLWKWTLAGLAGLLLLAMLMAGVGWWALDQGVVRDWALAKVQDKLRRQNGISLSYSRASGGILADRLELEHLRMTQGGAELFSAARVTIKPDFWSLLQGRLTINRLELVSPVITLTPAKNREPKGSGPGPAGDQGWFMPVKSLLVRDFVMTDWLLRPGPLADPLIRAKGPHALARVEWDGGGLRIKLRSFSAKTWLSVLDRPVQILNASALVTPGGFSGLKGRVECGGNSLWTTGGVSWSGGIRFNLDAKGGFSAYDRLPLYWFWPNPPVAPLGLKVKIRGLWPRMEFMGDLEMQKRVHKAQVILEWRKQTCDIRLDANGLKPSAWGLHPEPLDVTGLIRGELSGLKGSVRLGADAELSMLHHPRHGQGSAHLGFVWPGMELVVHESNLVTPWAKLKAAGRAVLSRDYLPGQFSGRVMFTDLVRSGILVEYLPKYLDGLKLNGEMKLQGGRQAQEVSLELKDSQVRPGLELSRLSMLGGLKGKSLDLKSLDALGDWGHLSGSGRIENGRADLAFDLSSTEPQALRRAFKSADLKSLPLKYSNLAAQGKLRGGWNDLGMEFQALARDLQAYGFSAGNVNLDADIKSLNQNPWGRLMLRAQGVDAKAGSTEGSRVEVAVSPKGKLTLKGQLNKVRSNAVLVRRLGLRAELDSVHTTAKGRVELLGSKVQALGRNWSGVEIKAQLAPGANQLNFAANSPGLSVSANLFNRAVRDRWREFAMQGLRFDLAREGVWRQKKQARLQSTAAGWRLNGLELVHNGETAALDAGLQGREVSAGIRLSGIQISRLLPQDPFFKGSLLDTQTILTGSLDDPLISASGSLRDIAWTGRSQARYNWRLKYSKDSGFSIDGSLSEAGQAQMEMSGGLAGRLSLWPPKWTGAENGGLEITLKGEKLPLKATAPVLEGVNILGGLINARLKASGSPTAPRISGWADLTGGRVEIAASKQVLQDINAELEFHDTYLDIKSFRAQSDGRIKGFGRVGLPWRGANNIRWDFELDDFSLTLPSLGRARLGAFISCQGTWQKPVIDGWVMPSQLDIFMGLAAPSALDDVVILQKGQKPPPIEQAKEPLIWNPKGFLGDSRFRVEIKLPQGKKVEAGPGWLKLAGGLTLKKQPHRAMTYHDSIKILDGLYILRGKSFEKARGVIDFKGLKEPHPALSLRAQHQAGSVLIFVNVGGYANDPVLQLTSQPPMSKADILSSMVFGRTRDQLNRQENRQLTAQALALVGMGSTQAIQDVIGPGLAPDVVTVHTEPGREGSYLETGKYLDQNLYLHYRENLGPESSRNVGLELKFTDWLSLDSQVGTARDTGVDLILNFDF